MRLVKMPRLGQDMERGTLLEWAKSVGEQVQEGEILAVIETEKAEVAFESPAGGFLVAVLLLLRWYGPSFLPASDTTVAEATGGGALARVTLFYLARDGTGLVGRERRVEPGTDALSRARAIVRRQLDPAPPPLFSPFPEGTRLRSLYVAADGNAFVDLSREVSADHPGGSLDELFTVYALVNALTLNVPEIDAVQILVGGREVDTLAGHIDLRQPLESNLAWVIDAPRGWEDDPATN